MQKAVGGNENFTDEREQVRAGTPTGIGADRGGDTPLGVFGRDLSSDNEYLLKRCEQCAPGRWHLPRGRESHPRYHT